MIGVGQATGLYASLTWTRLKRGRLLWACAALVALPVVGAAGLAIFGNWGRGLFDDILELYLRFLVPFVPALLASPVVAEEIDGRTFTFVFTRPAPRSALVLGKFLAVTLPVTAAMALSVALSWLVAFIPAAGDMRDNLPHLMRAEAAAVLGTVAFAALASALGSLFTRHPFVTVVGYLLIVEAGLGSTPIVLHLLALSWHLRNLVEQAPADSAFMLLNVPSWASAIVVLALTGSCLGGAVLAVTGAEYHGK